MVLAGPRIAAAEASPRRRQAQADTAQRRDQFVEQTVCRAACALGDYLDGMADQSAVEQAFHELSGLFGPIANQADIHDGP